MRYAGLSVLVLFALFAASACTLDKSSKVSEEDLARLNQAGASLIAISDQVDAGISKCSKSARDVACLTKLKRSYVNQMSSTATIYEQVADNTGGECGESLRLLASDVKGMAKAVERDSMPATQKAIKDEEAAFDACNLSG